MQVNHNTLSVLAINLSKASKDLSASHAKISSGEKTAGSKMDIGGIRQSINLENEIKEITHSMANMQNLVSYTQSQHDALSQAGKILIRMNELAERSIDFTKATADRNTYDHEFLELAEQLDSINGMKFNGLDLFTDGPFSESKRQFIEVLQSQWLSAAEKVIEERLGITGNGNDTLKINVNENGSENYSISLTWNYADPLKADNRVDVASLNYEIYNYDLPISGPSGDSPFFFNDRLNAIMVTYAVMAENLYFNALANGDVNKGGNNSGGAEWFKSGVSDFVHGGDLFLEIFGGFNQSTINAIGSGDASAASFQQRGSYYAAVRYLHQELKDQGHSLGVRDMLHWMSQQVKNGENSEASSIGAALQNFFGTGIYPDLNTANDEFINHYIGNALNDHNDPSNSFKIILGNFDTGAITGFDADGGAVIDHENAVPDSGNGYDPKSPEDQALSNFKLKWEKEGSLLTVPNPNGNSIIFEAANSITVDDKEHYNLKTVQSTRLTQELMKEWMDTLNEENGRVLANLNSLKNRLDNYQSTLTNYAPAMSRIRDTDFAEETTKLLKNEIKVQAAASILSKGQDTQFSIGQLLSGVGIQKKGQPKAAN